MDFALTFIGTVFDILFSDLFRSVFGVLLVAAAVSAAAAYVKILAGRW